MSRFGATQRWGHRASTLLCNPRIASPAISVLRRLPFLGRWAYENSRPS
jgi:hypothetical protein